MKTKLLTGITTIAAAAALAGFSAPAQAVSLSPTTFGNDGITFDTDTEVEFTFWESHGKYQSIFGIINSLTGERFGLFSETRGSNPGASDANDWLLSPEYISVNPEYIAGPLKAVFKFAAGVQYQLAYWGDNHTVDASLADFSYDGSLTYATTGPNWSGSPEYETLTVPGSVVIGLEDGWEERNNRTPDYNDFIVSAKLTSSASVPEPTATVALFGVGAAGLFGLRRRRTAN